MKDIKELLDNAERIGTIGSPSSTSELSIDILGTAVDKKLVGELAFFGFNQDGKRHYALGQITEIQLRNAWLEEPTMRSLARQKGPISQISGRQDTHLGQMTVSAVFSDEGNRFEPSILGTVPATGTYINLATEEILNTFLKEYKDEIFYLGYVYGSKPKLPLWFKHFGSGTHGAGEAYHIGIFGKTGSGKSVLAKMVMLAYARYPQMSIFVIDPQGEFAKDVKEQGNKEGFYLNLSTIFGNLGKPITVKRIKDLILDTWDLFSEILYESSFFEQLSIGKGENRRIACEILSERLKKGEVTLEKLNSIEAFGKALEILNDENVQKMIYKSEASRNRFVSLLQEATENKEEFFNSYWKPVAELFSTNRPGVMPINQIIYTALNLEAENRPVVIVDLSKETSEGMFWNETIQALVIKRLLDALTWSAESAYKQNKFLNTLVILDEAHRLAPREKYENEQQESVRISLIDAVRTTRKYGLGWMFISQTLSSLHREIINQLRILFFGFGLALGTEFQALSDIVGGDTNALKLYQSFRDPHSSFDVSSRQYAFMTVGPVSPLSFAGLPLFFTAFNTPEDFLKENNFIHNK
jgi:hypothetical protein